MSRNSARLGTRGRHLDLAAEPVRPFQQGDVVSPLGRGYRRLEPAGPAADHHHP